jgi:hypothetical protein
MPISYVEDLKWRPSRRPKDGKIIKTDYLSQNMEVLKLLWMVFIDVFCAWRILRVKNDIKMFSFIRRAWNRTVLNNF